jgi:mono/diheme cytochrome c family protein
MNESNQFIGLKVVLFTLIVIGIFTYYANSIPQLESRPPKELSLSKENLTPEALVQAGKDIFYGKGTCALCHAIGEKGPRAPDLAGIGARAATREPGKSAKDYLIESLINPTAYVVEGYPPIMPAVNKPPISLNPTEILAVVAFLESLGGTVDVKPSDIPSEASSTATAAAPAAPAPLKLPGNPEAGKAVAEVCVQCHVIPGVGKPRRPRAPDLSAIGAIATPDYIIESILDPDAKVVAGYPAGLMPKDFGEKLTAREFVDLVAFLMTLKGGPPESSESGKGTQTAEGQKKEGVQETKASSAPATEAKPAETEKKEGAETQGSKNPAPGPEQNKSQ